MANSHITKAIELFKQIGHSYDQLGKAAEKAKFNFAGLGCTIHDIQNAAASAKVLRLVGRAE